MICAGDIILGHFDLQSGSMSMPPEIAKADHKMKGLEDTTMVGDLV